MGKWHTTVPDPDIRFGPFRVLKRTDGKYVVIDTRLSMWAKPVSIERTVHDASVKAEVLWKLEEKK